MTTETRTVEGAPPTDGTDDTTDGDGTDDTDTGDTTVVVTGPVIDQVINLSVNGGTTHVTIHEPARVRPGARHELARTGAPVGALTLSAGVLTGAGLLMRRATRRA